jgi:hypothetical protein
VFENRILRSIFGYTKNEVTGEWGKLHNEAPHELYCSPIIIQVIQSRRTRWRWRTGVYRVFVGEPEGKKYLGRPRHRWEIIRWIFMKTDRGHGLDLFCSG